MQLAESIDNKVAKEVLKDIADEERVHAVEFLRPLKALAPDEEKFYQEGAAEVEEIIKKLKKNRREPMKKLTELKITNVILLITLPLPGYHRLSSSID